MSSASFVVDDASDSKKPLAQAGKQDYGSAKMVTEEEEEESMIFPFEPFCWLPSAIQAFLPGTVTRIVSVPHLVLLLASLTSLAVFIETIASWQANGCRTAYCEGRITPLVFVGLCMLYFCKTLQQYDERLVQKQKELTQAKAELDQRYKETIEDMEGFLAQAIETEVTFAERGFESHRRDFVRFLTHYGEQLKDFVATPESEKVDRAALRMFCSFVRRWLQYFSEASIEPVRRPLQVVGSDTMEQCKSRAEVATLVSDRLSDVEVKFISAQREKDRVELAGVRKTWNNTKALQHKALAFKEVMCGFVPALHKKDNDVESAQLATLSFEGDIAQHMDTTEKYTWVRWSRREGLGVKRDTEDVFPTELHLGCVTIILLSPEHIQLILSFFLGIAVLLLETIWIKGLKLSMIAETGVCLMCIAFILYDFLDIDIIQQLDAQLKELEAQQLEVLQKRERIMKFYSSCQQLGDLWLNHTIPQLDLIKYLFDGLQDVKIEDHVAIIENMERRLEDLERSAPALEQWCGEGSINEKQMKAFNTNVTEIVRRNQNTVETLDNMPKSCRQIRIAFGLEAPEAVPELTTKPAIVPQQNVTTTSRNSTAGPTYTAGSAVEYFSKGRCRWIPARVVRVDPVTGLLDLDCKDHGVEPSCVRPVPPEGSQQDAGCGQQ